MSRQNPLVSIVVVTYNSSKYIIETLESCKSQTYTNIELIVSDDASTDNTVELCENWIQDKRERFVSSRLVISESNTGIAPNINRGLSACSGSWVKPIAGDDVLDQNAISSYMDLTRRYSGLNVIHAEMKSFSGPLAFEHRIQKLEKREWAVNNANMTANDQLEILSRYNFISAPTMFVRKSLYDKLGNYNEKYPMIEDWPFIIKCLKNGVSLIHMDQITVFYRVHEGSVLRARSSSLVSRYLVDKAVFIQDELLQNYGRLERFLVLLLTTSYLTAAKLPWFFHRVGFQWFFNWLVYVQKGLLKLVRIKYLK